MTGFELGAAIGFIAGVLLVMVGVAGARLKDADAKEKAKQSRGDR